MVSKRRSTDVQKGKRKHSKDEGAEKLFSVVQRLKKQIPYSQEDG